MANETVKEDRPPTNAFMSLLKRHRMGLGLTQTQMGKRCGVGTATYSQWETGRCVPTPARFKKLAQVLNMAPMDLSLILVPMPIPEAAVSK